MNTESTTTDLPEETQYPEIEYVVRESPIRNKLGKRLGCSILLVIWFGFLLLPLALFILAINGEIRINHSADIPDSYEHPRFQIFLQMEPGFRGLQFTRTTIEQKDEQHLCLAVNVSYLLWEGQGDSAHYCDCYERDKSNNWVFVAYSPGSCS